jgi:hypothetical protein
MDFYFGGWIVCSSINCPKYEKEDCFCTFSGATIRPIWPNYKQQKKFRRSGLTWHPFLVLSGLQISRQLKNAAECQQTTVKGLNSQQQ